MRIRATKPEFWQSETIAQLDWDTRLILKALESYVDDNGVGKDSVTLFVTAAFPHDVEKSPEVFAKVARSLSRLSEVDIIVRYTVGGERLVYVRRWRKWQYIDKPKQGRHPRPDGTMNYRDDVDETIGAGQGVTGPTNPDGSPEPPENFAKTARKAPEDCPQIQSGEQGNRGTEQDPPYPPEREPSAAVVPLRKTGSEIARSKFSVIPTAASVTARQVADAYNDSLPVPLEAKLLADVSAEIDRCLRSSIPPEAIAAGIQEWTRSDSWSPSQIPKFVHKAASRAAPRNGVGKPTESALDYQAAAESLLTKVSTK